MSSQPIRFFHRGSIASVSDAAPTRTLLDWLREDARCTGTKEGCNEGDCGACTVVVGELPEHADAPGQAVRGLTLRSVNACLQFLPTMHGKALFTVEDLKQDPSSHRTLHPVQQAMVDCHGSQCGFCTPGFVMSMWGEYERHRACATRPTRREMADALSGNLCRCTGYRPILDAGERMFELPSVALDTAPVIAALRAIDSGSTFTYQPPGLARFDAPRTLDELAALREQRPDARLLSGATDIGLWVNKQLRELGDILYLGRVDELRRIADQPDELWIGAGVSLEAAWGELVKRCPPLSDMWLRFASPPIRHAGTLGGNVANGSPIGDGPPVLIALDAQIELRRGTRVRRLPLADFYVDYMKNRLEPGEFVQAIAIPQAAFARQIRGYKISKRYDSDISAVCGAFAIELDGEVVKSVRLVYGGLAGIVKRAAGAEAALLGQPWSQASVTAAQAALAHDFKPLTDMRASAGYRLQVAQNLLTRLWLETRATDPLPAQATSVWLA